MPTTANINCNIWFIRRILPIDFIEAKTHLTTYYYKQKQEHKQKQTTLLIEHKHYVTESQRSTINPKVCSCVHDA